MVLIVLIMVIYLLILISFVIFSIVIEIEYMFKRGFIFNLKWDEDFRMLEFLG